MAEHKDNSISTVMESLMKSAGAALTSKTVVGEPVKIDDTIIIPLVDVSIGMGAGASLKGSTSNGSKNAGAGGLSAKMSPNAILMIKNGQTKLINIKNQDNVSKIMDMIPEVVNRFTAKKEEMVDDETAKEAAFPSDEA